MPLIHIESLKTDKNINAAIEAIYENAQKETAFPKDRLVIKWTFINTDFIYRHGKKIVSFEDDRNPILVSLSLSKRNSRKDTEKLLETIVKSISESISFDSGRILAVINHMDEGNIYVGNGYI